MKFTSTASILGAALLAFFHPAVAQRRVRGRGPRGAHSLKMDQQELDPKGSYHSVRQRARRLDKSSKDDSDLEDIWDQVVEIVDNDSNSGRKGSGKKKGGKKEMEKLLPGGTMGESPAMIESLKDLVFKTINFGKGDTEFFDLFEAVNIYFSELIQIGSDDKETSKSLQDFFGLPNGIKGLVVSNTVGLAFQPDYVETVDRFGDLYLSDSFGQVAPFWSVKKYPDGENSHNTEYLNQYAWAGDFHQQCGYGVMIHSAGTSGYIDLKRTNATMTFRNAEAEIVMKWEMDTPLLGIRSAIITGCPDDTIELIAWSVGFMVIGMTVFPSTLYKVTVNLADNSVSMDVLIDDLIPLLEANSVRAMTQAYDGNDCHVAFSPLREDGLDDQLYPVIWTMDICADNVTDTLTKNTLYRENAETTSLMSHVIWDFECEDDIAGGMCWYNLVTVQEDEQKASGLDLIPLLFYGRKSDLSAPSSAESSIPVVEIDTTDFMDSSSLSIEPLGQGEVVVCTLSGYTYQAVFSKDYNILDVNDPDSLTTRFEAGAGQECYFCNVLTNDCRSVLSPGMVESTIYIWQVEKCGDYIFFGTYDGSALMSSAMLQVVMSSVAGETAFSFLPEDFEGGLLEGAGGLLLSIYLDDVITVADYGFDLWYIPVELIGSVAFFEPVTLDGFRGLQYDTGDGSVDGCKHDFYENYDPLVQVEDGVRKLVCHMQQDGSDPKLLIGGAAFNEGQFSSTYVVSMSDECSVRPSI